MTIAVFVKFTVSPSHPSSHHRLSNRPGPLMKPCLGIVLALALGCWSSFLTPCLAQQPDPQTPSEPYLNELSPAEIATGWELLFDGKSLDQWRGYRSDTLNDGWVVKDGAFSLANPGAGDLVTRQSFDWFELLVDYRISPGGNSGVMFHVGDDQPQPYRTGPEVQILDNQGADESQKSGWLYDLYKPGKARGRGNKSITDAFRGPDQWNQLYIRVSPLSCEVCLNGVKYYEFQIGNDDWNRRVAASKFADFANFGKLGRGSICLQDHGNPVAFRNLKIRRLGDDQTQPSVAPNDAPTINVASELAFPDLKWDQWEPVDEMGRLQSMRLVELTFAPEQPDRLYAVSQTGEIWTFENRRDVTESTLFLDLHDTVMQHENRGANEQGLLGLAMHPRFAKNGRFYTYHSRADNSAAVITQWQCSAENPLVADPESGTELLTIEQPYGNHNGGSIAFGPDGFLYAGVGDGGSANDPHGNGQNTSVLLGSILRIDVDRQQNGLPYGIPEDNPLVNVENARPEIFAWGLRNPWKIAFDPASGALWTADVGQDLWEEINVIQKGGNYGWSIREGWHPFGSESSAASLIDPVWEYDHQQGKSITGGKVYRGEQIPSLQGKYVYADYVSGTMWALTYDPSNDVAATNELLLPNAGPVLSFAQDDSGEILFLVTDPRGQGIRRLIAREKMASR